MRSRPDFSQGETSTYGDQGEVGGQGPRSNTQASDIRKLFGNIHEAVEMPNLIEVQREIL